MAHNSDHEDSVNSRNMKPEKKFEVGDVWVNGAGDKYRIIYTEAPGTHPVVAIDAEAAANEHVGTNTYMPDGVFYADGEKSEYDLVRKVEPKLRIYAICTTSNNTIFEYHNNRSAAEIRLNTSYSGGNYYIVELEEVTPFLDSSSGK